MKKYFILSLFFGLISCATKTKSVVPTPTETVTTTKTTTDFSVGKELYANNCNSCHSLYSPHQFTNEQWTNNLNAMQPKAKITDEQKDLIYKYLVNASKTK